MFTERYRSHHDAENRLAELLDPGRGSGGMMRGSPLLRRLFRLLGLKPPAGHWKELEKILREKPAQKNAGVYIHVPYCDKICSFCNLNRTERKGADLDAYTGYLVSEIKKWGGYPYIQGQHIESVYFGGGTPTVLNTGQFQTILSALKDHFPLTGDCEISVESTQHNLGVKKAAALEAAGVNRFSIGIQTFSDRGRRLLARTYSEKKAKEELLALRKNFGGVLGIDIIYSYPDQSLDEIRQDAEMCISSRIDSVSFYSLMIQKGSALSNALEQNELTFKRDIDFDLQRHNLFYKTLTEAGFNLLELSKLARPDRDRYRYIHIQYGDGDLIPIGSGAGGTVAGFPVYSMAPGRRMTAAPNPRYEKYHRILGMLQFGVYDPEVICGELGPQVTDAIGGAMAPLEKEGLLEPFTSEGRQAWKLSADGVFWGNNIAVTILDAAIKAENSNAGKGV